MQGLPQYGFHSTVANMPEPNCRVQRKPTAGASRACKPASTLTPGMAPAQLRHQFEVVHAVEWHAQGLVDPVIGRDWTDQVGIQLSSRQSTWDPNAAELLRWTGFYMVIGQRFVYKIS